MYPSFCAHLINVKLLSSRIVNTAATARNWIATCIGFCSSFISIQISSTVTANQLSKAIHRPAEIIEIRRHIHYNAYTLISNRFLFRSENCITNLVEKIRANHWRYTIFSYCCARWRSTTQCICMILVQLL